MTQFFLSSNLSDNDLAAIVGSSSDPVLRNSAFRELERRFQARFAAELRKHPSLLRDQSNAIQEMRLALFQAARRFDPNRGVKFSTYLKRDLLGAVSAAKRHQGPIHEELDEDLIDYQTDRNVDYDRKACIKALLTALTARESSVLAALSEERSIAEIAGLLKISKSTVFETVGRIRRKALFVGLSPTIA